MAGPAAAVRDTRNRLRKWASASGIPCDSKGYVLSLEQNFFQPLTACTLRELEQGDGGELGKPGAPGKIRALHSSSALACNVFDYWRGRDTEALAGALGTSGRFCAIQFEAKFPTGLRGKAPNLDVLLGKSGGGDLAVESKFLEPYAGTKARAFKDKYFPEGAGLWTAVGLHQAQALANQLHERPDHYRHLDAQQLLKHLLGLGHRTSATALLYLWYDIGGDTGSAHASEIQAFLTAIQEPRLSVAALSYQDLFRALEATTGQEHQQYVNYLRQRYFGAGG